MKYQCGHSFFWRILFCFFYNPKCFNSPAFLSLANIWSSLNADFHVVRNEGRFGQGQRGLLLWFFYFSTLRGRPPPLSAARRLTGAGVCAPGNLTFGNRSSFPKRKISIFHSGVSSTPTPAFTAPPLADPVLALSVSGISHTAALGCFWDGSGGFKVPVARVRDWSVVFWFGRLCLLQRPVLQVFESKWNTNITHRKLCTRQLQKLSGSVWTTWRPSLAKHEEGVLKQHLHTHLEKGATRKR